MQSHYRIELRETAKAGEWVPFVVKAGMFKPRIAKYETAFAAELKAAALRSDWLSARVVHVDADDKRTVVSE